MRTSFVVLVAITLLTIVGCTKETSTVNSPATPAVTLSPADGETSVQLDAAITLQFAKPVDPALVEKQFHLISERDMADSLCPYSTQMDHSNMMVVMSDTGKMHHLDSAHATRGTFSWSSGNTVCTFRPSAMMGSKTSYMMHMGADMVSMMEQDTGSMQNMTGHGQGMMSNEMMFHFTTLDTTSTTGGGGHGGHH